MRYGRRIFWLAAIPLTVSMLIATLAPQPHGHWSEHLSGAGLKSVQLVLLLALLTMLGWRRLSVPLLLAFGVVASGIVFQVLGDAQVAESIWRTSGNPERGDGYESGHETSELGDLLAFAGGLAFAIAAGIARRVPLKLAIGAAVLTIFPPPFFWPAVGVLVLLFHGLTSEQGFQRGPGAVVPGPPSHAPS
jgi:hypothetical protein